MYSKYKNSVFLSLVVIKNQIKKNMIQVNSSQFNYVYNKNIHFPYSIATLIAYVKSNNNLNSNFNFEKTFVFRDDIEKDIKKCENTDILLCSCSCEVYSSPDVFDTNVPGTFH